MKAFSVIFAVLLLLGTAISLRSEDTVANQYTITLNRNSPINSGLSDSVAVRADSVDTLTIGPMPNDMGLMGVWIQADSVPTQAAGTLIDSLRFYWKVLNKGAFWRPLFIDSMTVSGALTGYVTTGGAKASTAGITLTTGIAKYAVFYDPNAPMPIPLIAEGDYIQIMVSRTNFDPVWVNKFTFYLRYERSVH